MIFKIGDEVLSIGKCHPSQARILVKKDLATWEDGNIKVILRNAQAEAFEHNQDNFLHGPSDNKDVSMGEMDRRLDWFKNVILKTTLAAGGLGRSGQDVNPEEMGFYKVQGESLKYIATAEAPGVALTEE
ncbi:MAG: hypothetical protein WCO84_06895, partial [bacterium]